MPSGTTIGSAYVQIIPSAEGLQGRLSDLFSGGEAEAAGESIGKKIGSSIAKAVAALGIGKMISQAISDGMDFEQTMAKTSTLFSGTSAELEALESQILSISGSTGVVASELANAAYSAESASVPMKNLGGMIEASAKLATAGFTDIDTALSATAKTMNAYGMMSDDVAETQANLEKVQRILIQTQNKGITTVGELGASLAQVTPTAAAFGVSFDQVGAALAGMTAQGTPTAQATTQLNSLIAELGKEGTTASKHFKELTGYIQEGGLTFAEAMERGWDLSDVLSIMEEGANTAGVSMVDMFSSIEAGKAAMSIWNSDWAGNMEAMATEADVVGEAYDKMGDTVSFKLQKVKNELKNIGIDAFSSSADFMVQALQGVSNVLEIIQPSLHLLGESFVSLFQSIGQTVGELLGLDEGFSASEAIAEALKIAIETLASGVQFLADHMDAIVPVLSGLTAAFVAFKAASGIMSIIKTITGISSAITAAGGLIPALTALVSPVGLVAAAIGAAVAIGVTLYKNWDTIKEKAAELGAAIKEKWEGIKTAISEKVANIKTDVSEAWSNIRAGAEEKWSAIKTTVSSAAEGIRQAASNTWDNMKASYEAHGGGMIGVAGAWWDGMKSAYEAGYNILNSLTGGKLEEIQNTFSNIFNNVWNIVSNAIQNVRSLFNFNWHFPELRLPHIKFDLIQIPVVGTIPDPFTFRVEWYKKAYTNPYMFTNPTLMGFGDGNGGEMVYGHENLMRDIEMASGGRNWDAIGDVLERISDFLEELQLNGVEANTYLDGRLVSDNLTIHQRRTARAGGLVT